MPDFEDIDRRLQDIEAQIADIRELLREGGVPVAPGARDRKFVNIDLNRMLRGLPAESFRKLLEHLEETNPLALRRWRRSLSGEDKALLDSVDE